MLSISNIYKLIDILMVRFYLALTNCMEVEFLNHTKEISEQFSNRPNQKKDRHFLERKYFAT